MGAKVAVQRDCVNGPAGAGWHADHHGPVYGLRRKRTLAVKPVEFQAQVAVGAMRADAPGAVKKLDVPIDRAQLAPVADAAALQSSVYVGPSPHLAAPRHI